MTDQRHRQSIQRLLRTGRLYVKLLLWLLLLTLASGIFAYLVSPLRDPAFQPNSANAGSLLPWMQGVRERDWIWGATGLAGLLTTNLMLLLRQWSYSRTSAPSRQTRPVAERILLVGTYLGLGTAIFVGLWLLFIAYLLAQWLVD